MKALSIRSDYAAEIMHGTKTEEYRTWSTKYRGDLLICNTAKKIRGFVPGYALCVAKIIDVEQREDDNGRYYAWKIAPFTKNGSYWIDPLPIKGQLGLFNVDDRLIKRAPFAEIHSRSAKEWLEKVVAPLRY
ncbi:ASCH domain-containing protein [Limosilactobacillus sp. Sa3CUN2]|uniref:ASCH domain-containing protein n=1 Tax=Limosilactobacillus avistercoris TaxID=2762243 RepID=A0ABR8PDQ9_9LACO|nr:ASCH domain-containing protein [Limosilactobacillus avistercoris]MBD7895428.1 ASCH domain-containing protein [Limosilactobacillus avistercoris]